MFKQSISLIILGIFIFGFNSNKAEAALDAILFFDQATGVVGIGQNVVLVSKINPGSNQISAAQLNIAFDPDVFRLDSVIPGNAFNVILTEPSIDNVTGRGGIYMGILTNPATYVETISSIATFTFTALTSATNSTISILPSSNASSLGQHVVSSRIGAEITVESSDSNSPNVPGGLSVL